jgi:futalosine hydrolase
METAVERRRRTGASIESMEGAAWALACQSAGVPFAQVRSISNVAGPRDRPAWRIPQALAALRRSLEESCRSI